MAKLKGKGTKLQQFIATVFVDIAQVLSIDLSGAGVETFESDTLDNAATGIPYDLTGRAEGGTVSMELFYDPSLAGHQTLTDNITTPAKVDYKVIYADTKEEPFSGMITDRGVRVALNDGLKSTMQFKVDKLATFPT